MDYADYDKMKNWSEANFGICPSDLHHYFKAELARHDVRTAGAKILEIGYGGGQFLGFARAEGATVVGVEIQPMLVHFARAKGFQAYSSLDEAAQDEQTGFDLVAAFDVFEHLSAQELIDMLQRIGKLLKPQSGKIIARFPNGDSPLSMPIQNGDYTHKLSLGAGAVDQILYQAGWRRIYLGDPVWTAPGLSRRVALKLRVAARRAFETALAAMYYGAGAPKSLYYNSILIASPNAS
ncbi:MAG: class I SAM-dependent methyltransferase [Hyphomicrobiales bacterium]|nr:class I SAM-dependent methyltransferase [Hyphomicrobiales bacterium]